jgi:nitrogen fixation protein
MGVPTEKEISNLCRRFGTIAVKNNFISKSQLKEAIIEQLEEDLSGKDHRLIGAILLEKGWISWDQVDLVLKELFSEE